MRTDLEEGEFLWMLVSDSYRGGEINYYVFTDRDGARWSSYDPWAGDDDDPMWSGEGCDDDPMWSGEE